MPGSVRSAALQLRTAQRVVRSGRRRRCASAAGRRRADGLRRSAARAPARRSSGARSARLPGFVDLGEVAPLKAAIPELARLRSGSRPRSAIRRILDRDAAPGARRTPARGRADARDRVRRPRAAALAYPRPRAPAHRPRRPRRRLLAPRARLARARGGGEQDDAGAPLRRRAPLLGRAGAARRSFGSVSDARRAAWAWRRYVRRGPASAERASRCATRSMARDPGGVAARLAERLGVDSGGAGQSAARAPTGRLVGRATGVDSDRGAARRTSRRRPARSCGELGYV